MKKESRLTRLVNLLIENGRCMDYETIRDELGLTRDQMSKLLSEARRRGYSVERRNIVTIGQSEKKIVDRSVKAVVFEYMKKHHGRHQAEELSEAVFHSRTAVHYALKDLWVHGEINREKILFTNYWWVE